MEGTMNKSARWLRRAFLLGAATDAGAVVPMLHEGMAKRLWGFSDVDTKYRFAMRFGAALMVGWTLLLLWASSKPVERRPVALMTVQVIAGFVATEIIAVKNGYMDIRKAAPSWIMQAILSGLFIRGYLAARNEDGAAEK
jgi:hypothetical protein